MYTTVFAHVLAFTRNILALLFTRGTLGFKDSGNCRFTVSSDLVNQYFVKTYHYAKDYTEIFQFHFFFVHVQLSQIFVNDLVDQG